MGATTTICYSCLGWRNNELFLSFVTAIPLTMAAVRFLPDLRGDHIAAFPPRCNLSLAFWIFAVPFLTRVSASLSAYTYHLWDFLRRHIRRLIRRLRVPWNPEDELPLHRRD